MSKEFELEFGKKYNLAGGGFSNYDILETIGQSVNDFSKDDFIYFYGDMMAEGQNDFPLANLIRTKKLGFTYLVHSYEHTWDI